MHGQQGHLCRSVKIKGISATAQTAGWEAPNPCSATWRSRLIEYVWTAHRCNGVAQAYESSFCIPMSSRDLVAIQHHSIRAQPLVCTDMATADLQDASLYKWCSTLVHQTQTYVEIPNPWNAKSNSTINVRRHRVHSHFKQRCCLWYPDSAWIEWRYVYSQGALCGQRCWLPQGKIYKTVVRSVATTEENVVYDKQTWTGPAVYGDENASVDSWTDSISPRGERACPEMRKTFLLQIGNNKYKVDGMSQGECNLRLIAGYTMTDVVTRVAI